jgi:hypothetical protein
MLLEEGSNVDGNKILHRRRWWHHPAFDFLLVRLGGYFAGYEELKEDFETLLLKFFRDTLGYLSSLFGESFEFFFHAKQPGNSH